MALTEVLEYLKQIEEAGYKGNSIFIAYGVLAQLVTLLKKKGGFGIIYIGSKGCGKTTVIEQTPCIMEYDYNRDRVLKMDIYMLIWRMLQNNIRKVLFRIKEWNTMDDYSKDVFFETIPSILSDGSYSGHIVVYEEVVEKGKRKKKKVLREVEINGIRMCNLIAIQPLTYAKMLQGRSIWTDMVSDRYLKIVFVNPLREEEEIEEELTPPQIKIEDDLIEKYKNMKIDKEIRRLKSYKLLKEEIFDMQFTRGRSLEYLNCWIKAYALLKGHKKIDSNTVKEVLKVSAPIAIYNFISETPEIGEEPIVKPVTTLVLTTIQKEIRKDQLLRFLRIKNEQLIKPIIEELKTQELIEEKHTKTNTKYKLSKKLRQIYTIAKNTLLK